MANNYINRFTLKFLNHIYENEFSAKDVRRKYKLQLAITIFYTLMTVLNLGLIGYNLGIIIHTSVLYLCIFIGYYKRLWVCYTNVIIIILTQYTYINFIKDGESQGISIGEIFLNGQGASSIYLLCSQSFIIDTIAVISSQFLIRFTMDDIPLLYILDACQIILINSLAKYLQFRQERIAFFEKKKKEQLNQSLDNLFQNGIIITKYDHVTAKVSLHDCNQQARKFKIEDDESFLTFSKNVKIDLIKSKISVLLQSDKNTLKDYLLLKHYHFSNLELHKQITHLPQKQQTSPQNKISGNSDNNSSLKKNKNDVLHVIYENTKNPGSILRFKIKAGTLIFEEPFIILSIQDVSSQSNLTNLKMKSAANDLIYIKSINEIRDKAVKIISTISSSKFFPSKSISNVPNQAGGGVIKISGDDYNQGQTPNISYNSIRQQKSFNDEISRGRKDEFNEHLTLPIQQFIQDQVTFQPNSEYQSQKFIPSPLQSERNIQNSSVVQSPKKRPSIDQNYTTNNDQNNTNNFELNNTNNNNNTELNYTNNENNNSHNNNQNSHNNTYETHNNKDKINITHDQNNNTNNEDQNIQIKNEKLNQHQDHPQIILQAQKSGNSQTTFSKSNVLLVPGFSDQITSAQVVTSSSGNNINNNIAQLALQNNKGNENNSFTIKLSDAKQEEFSEIASEQRSYKPSLYHNPYQRIIKKSSIYNQSFQEGDSLQFIENDDMESKIAHLRLSMSCLLNNTYSLLDYMILSGEKSHFKKLQVKPQTIPLKKIESYMKFLFPNLIVSYTSNELSEKEINTDIRRLKYILISIISSFFFKKKSNDTSFYPTSNRLIACTLNNIPEIQNNQQQPIKKTLHNNNSNANNNNANNVQSQSFNYMYDKSIEIYLNISLVEQQQFNSINFSIQNTGSINLQGDVGNQYLTNPLIQNTNQQIKNKSESNININNTPPQIRNRKSEPELLSSMVAASLCVNATTDQLIRQMEIKNIYFNIMRIGPNIPEYDQSMNLFSFDIFEDLEVINLSPKNRQPSITSQVNTTPQTQGITSNHQLNLNNLYGKSPKTLQYEAVGKNQRKSNFYLGNNIVSPKSNTNIKSFENVRKKSAQAKNKQNIVDNNVKVPKNIKKTFQINDMIKQLEIKQIKENIYKFEDECDISSYKTFYSGLDQKIEEHLQDSNYFQKKLPASFWEIQQQQLSDQE